MGTVELNELGEVAVDGVVKDHVHVLPVQEGSVQFHNGGVAELLKDVSFIVDFMDFIQLYLIRLP